MSNTTVDMLLEVIDQGFNRQSWHGPNLRGSIRGVTRDQAIWRPAPQRHNIWEHVLHTAYWKYTVRRRILQEKRGSFPLPGSNWIEPRESTERAWREHVRLLVEVHESLRAAIADLPAARLRRQIQGSKVSYFFLISGVAAHDVYHAGQIQLLKRLREESAG